MPQFDVTAPLRRQGNRLARIAGETDRTTQRATGTLLRRLPVQARRDIQDEYNLPARRIAEGITATRGEGFVELRGSKRGIGLINFGGRWGGRKSAGATAQVRRTEGRTVYSGTFITTLRSSNRQIVERELDAGHRVGRLPVRTLYGPSMAHLLRNADRRDRLVEFSRDTLRDEVERLTKGEG